MSSDNPFARIAVVGTSCSGKTTFARAAARVLECPHVELDALYWGPDWTPRPSEELRRTLDAALSEPRWVCDGNYTSLRPVVWGRATAVVWLNYSFVVVFSRALTRTVRRVLTRERLWAGNYESFSRSFLSHDSILLWVLSTYRRNRQRYPRLFALEEFGHLEHVELRTARDTEAFLHTLLPTDRALPNKLVG